MKSDFWEGFCLVLILSFHVAFKLYCHDSERYHCTVFTLNVDRCDVNIDEKTTSKKRTFSFIFENKTDGFVPWLKIKTISRWVSSQMKRKIEIKLALHSITYLIDKNIINKS